MPTEPVTCYRYRHRHLQRHRYRFPGIEVQCVFWLVVLSMYVDKYEVEVEVELDASDL